MTTLPKEKHALVIQGSEQEKQQACIEIRDWAVENGIPIFNLLSEISENTAYVLFNPSIGIAFSTIKFNEWLPEYTIHHTVESFKAVFEGEDTLTSLPIEFIEWYSGMTREKVMRAFERWKRESTIQELNPIELTNPKN